MSNIKSVVLENTVYQNNKSIKTVNLDYVPWKNDNMSRAFYGCNNITDVSNINENVTNMSQTFSFCNNLVNAPAIPNSVTNMYETFGYCYNLVNAPIIGNGVTDMISTFRDCPFTTAPIIPNSVVNMYGTFMFCSNLTTAPIIPNSVVNLNDTFRNCPFTTAPNIPENVVDMANTFKWCKNLTGDIYIHSEYVSTFNECFDTSYKPKTIYMPFNSKTPRQVQLYAYTNMQMYTTYYVDKIPTYDDYNGVPVYDSEGSKVPNCMAQGDEYSVSIVWTDSPEGWPLYCDRDETSDKFVEKYVSQTYESFMADYGDTYNGLYNITLKDINTL